MTEEEALNRVAAYCSAAEHCRAEVSDKLQKWGIAYDAIERILARLEAEKYIDDERYCRAFIGDKFRFAKWGKMKIGQGLYMKKIPSNLLILLPIVMFVPIWFNSLLKNNFSSK